MTPCSLVGFVYIPYMNNHSHTDTDMRKINDVECYGTEARFEPDTYSVEACFGKESLDGIYSTENNEQSWEDVVATLCEYATKHGTKLYEMCVTD